jgi:hypothetical protein
MWHPAKTLALAAATPAGRRHRQRRRAGHEGDRVRDPRPSFYSWLTLALQESEPEPRADNACVTFPNDVGIARSLGYTHPLARSRRRRYAVVARPIE